MLAPPSGERRTEPRRHPYLDWRSPAGGAALPEALAPATIPMSATDRRLHEDAALRRPLAEEVAWVHGRGGRGARPRHRRQHRHLQPGGGDLPAAAAVR